MIRWQICHLAHNSNDASFLLCELEILAALGAEYTFAVLQRHQSDAMPVLMWLSLCLRQLVSTSRLLWRLLACASPWSTTTSAPARRRDRDTVVPFLYPLLSNAGVSILHRNHALHGH